MKVAPEEIVAFLRENWRLTQPSVVEAHRALLLVDPANDTPFPSASRNTVHFFDASGADDPSLNRRAAGLVEHYRSRNCSHCFVYVQPTATVQNVMNALTDAGFRRFDTGNFRPTYHTLGRSLTGEFDDRRERPHDIRRLPPAPEDGEVIERFGVFDGQTCVGRAALHTIGRYALLAAASTDESHRRQGIQTALIRTRLRRAREKGCTFALSETLSILGSSLGNLKRAGFQILYDKPVFEWRRSA